MERLIVPSETFDRLAAGDGDMSPVLRTGLRSKRLLLLHELRSKASRDSRSTFDEAGAGESYGVLADAHRRNRQAVEEVILHPHVGVWATNCLRQLATGSKIAREDMGHLGGIAAAAALRAGCAFEVTAYAREGWVMLPTYGAARVEDFDGWCRLRGDAATSDIEMKAGARHAVRVSVVSGDDSTSWRPLRRLCASADGVTFEAEIDDLDPYRGDGQLPIADRLDPAVVETWERRLAEAWQLLMKQDPDRCRAIAGGVRVVVPLLATDVTAELSASYGEGIGALGMTPPASPLSVALAFVHEFQHTKLSALLDLVPLVELSPEATFYAPWRGDPRPLWGLLHGTYAFLGLAVFWDMVRQRRGDWDPGASDDWAHFEFAHARQQVERAVSTLLGSGGLRPAGDRFVRAMQRRVLDLVRLPVPDVPLSLARLACLDHECTWQVRNIRVDVGRVAAWADAWYHGRPFPGMDGELRTVDRAGEVIASTPRLSLLRRRLAFPGTWRDELAPASSADAQLLTGDLEGAAAAYERQIERSPDDLWPWVGLSLLAHLRPDTSTEALRRHIDLVRALHGEIRQRHGEPPNPSSLAGWMSAPAS